MPGSGGRPHHQLKRVAPELAAGRVVVAHLRGASLCGLKAGVSRDTSMSFSTLDGIPIATRCGALDPGVLIHLLKKRGMTIGDVEDTIYHRSGLLGVSGISADTGEFLVSPEPAAREALAFFAFRIARDVAANATTLDGIDRLVFTAGIVENRPAFRDAFCRHLACLDIALDVEATHATPPASALAMQKSRC